MTVMSLFDQLIDQYKLEKHIAQKACTDLYLAYDSENRMVALEILLPNFAEDKEFSRRFLEKMRMVAQLKHPHIAQIFQVGVTPKQRPYIARELIEDYSLTERLEQLAEVNSPAPALYILQIIRQIAETLAFTERLGIFHHDLRPDNIMLTLEGNVVLVDLGVPEVKPKLHTANGTTSGPILAYLSPEQLQGKPIDGRSHVYSLGVILYELLAGHLPPLPESRWDVVQAWLPTSQYRLEKVVPGLAPEIYELVEKSIQPFPWRRYATIEEFIEAVDSAIVAERLRIQNGVAATAPPPPTRRHWLYFFVPALVLVFLAIGFLMTQLGGNQPDQSTPTQEVETAPAVGVPTLFGSGVETPATATATATPTETAVPLPTRIALIGPAAYTPVQVGNEVTVWWDWPAELMGNQQFIVSLYFEGRRIMIGAVVQPEEGTTYSATFTAPLLGEDTDVYTWQVVLSDVGTNTRLAESEERPLVITLPPTATSTATPTATNTATATSTPTPTDTATPTPTRRPLTPTPTSVPPTLTPSPTQPLPPTSPPPTSPPADTPVPPTATATPFVPPDTPTATPPTPPEVTPETPTLTPPPPPGG